MMLLHLILYSTLFAQPTPRPAYSEPHMATERGEIVFVSGGDIWRVPANGGEATLLVSHPAEESRPLLSPDGARLAFVSTRTGGGDIYVLTIASGALHRITFEDGAEDLDAWSRDGQWLYYHSATSDIGNTNDVFKVRSTGGTPIAVAADRYANEFFAAPSPDGKMLAINGRGIASRQWWRHGHSHIDISEILLVKPGAPPSYERVTDGGAKEIWPMWAADSKALFFVSDRANSENIWRQPLGGTSRQITSFKDGRVLWPSISYDGRVIVFERDLSIWKLETKDAGKEGKELKAAMLPIQLRGSSAGVLSQHLTLRDSWEELALSPDGKKIVVLDRGDLFAAAKDGGDARQVTRTPAVEMHATWAPDSRRLAYVSNRNGSFQVFLYDFSTSTETQLTSSGESDAAPRFSPDGKSLAFFRGGKGLWRYDIEKKQELQLSPAEVGRIPLGSARAFAWSPDSQWIAFASRGVRSFTNVMVVPVTGGPAAPVSFLANSYTRTVEWTPDGRSILFDTGQRTEQARVARIDLTPRTPRFREDRFRDLFRTPESPSDPKTKKVEIVFDGIRERLTLLRLGIDVNDFTVSPDGRSLLVTAEGAGQENLYTYPLEDTPGQEAVARQITSTAGAKKAAQWVSGGKEAVYLERGKPHSITLETRVAKAVSVSAEIDINQQQERLAVFQEAWAYLRDHFFDERFNGADWNALRKQYESYVAAAKSTPEMYRLVNLMLGELNASHLGISAGREEGREDAAERVTGFIGVRWDPAALEKGLFVISEVIPQGPADIAGLKPGDTITAVQGRKLDAATNLYELLNHTVGKRLELTLDSRTVAVRPITRTAEKNLLYRAWVAGRRAYVEKASNGRLGYVHMNDMSDRSLAQLYVDLDAGNHAREGVVIDIRNNNGGFVNAYALDVFARKPYLTFLERGRSAVSARSSLGQRSLELPTILVINQHSLSDAEDFTEGYRRLKLGKVVGEPTAGWIVYTWSQRLMDGSSFRLPRTKVFDNDGVLMEMHPRPVDIPVDRPVGESYSGKDSQLDTAVRELLSQIDASRKPPASPSSENR